ncbi:MAG: RimK family alpha-L-glutamate ligase [Methylomonas sp.]|nr:MAG: RimK family alpha-L-glutamate ligase [Methylomonas sp.]
MSRTLLVIDNLSDWGPYYPSDQVVSFEQYLTEQSQVAERLRIINLCNCYDYLADGYYCSLLAEARSHHVIPSVTTLNDLGNNALYQLQLNDFSQPLARAFKGKQEKDDITLYCYFGTTAHAAYQELARRLFERFPCPILAVTLHFKEQWGVAELKAVPHRQLDDAEQTRFAEALDKFSKKIWHKSRARKAARFDLAILADPDEKLPPSNRAALKKFIKAGTELGIDVELIVKHDYGRLPEFDGLFIRETTAVNHHTYRFAKKAEAEGLVVIDDPSSIMRCANKIYLADLFRIHRVPSPKTIILHKGNGGHLDHLEREIGFPAVIKIPDGSFSRGIVKVGNRQELEQKLAELFQESALLLAQEFLYTDFDWRIGIFNNKALYACRYYMVKNHWQIYRYTGRRTDSGDSETLPTFEVPKAVLNAAAKATQLIGNGFYGVDVKEINGKGYVMEVNDNPSIDSGVEDKYLGDELYRQIMTGLLTYMENRSKQN